MASVWASVLASYGSQVVPHAILWCLVVTGWCLGTARGLPGGFRAHKECLKKFKKCVFSPLAAKWGGLGVPLYILVRKWTPIGSRLVRKVSQDNNFAPFSSDKIRAKILD